MSWLRRHRADVTGESGPIDVLQRDSAALRRWIVLGGCVAVLLLAGLSIVLAWQQYDDAKAQAESDLRARVVAVAALIDTSFTGQIADALVDRQGAIRGRTAGAADGAVLPPGQPARGRPRSREGSAGSTATASSGRRTGAGRNPPEALANRDYFQAVVATHRPYVSAGLISKAVQQPVIVVAVPTFGPGGTVHRCPRREHLLKTVGESRQSLELGYGSLQLVDRNGRLLLGGLEHVRNTVLLERIRGCARASSGPGLRRRRRRRRRLRHGAGTRLGHGDRPAALVGVRVGPAGARSSSSGRCSPACCSCSRSSSSSPRRARREAEPRTSARARGAA